MEDITMFGDHVGVSIAHLGGEQVSFLFANGYGASVIRHEYSYGGQEGKWEVAVLDSEGRLTYDTPVASDVVGHLTPDEVASMLDRITAMGPKALEA
jgi:hypothetical protein